MSLHSRHLLLLLLLLLHHITLLLLPLPLLLLLQKFRVVLLLSLLLRPRIAPRRRRHRRRICSRRRGSPALSCLPCPATRCRCRRRPGGRIGGAGAGAADAGQLRVSLLGSWGLPPFTRTGTMGAFGRNLRRELHVSYMSVTRRPRAGRAGLPG